MPSTVNSKKNVSRYKQLDRTIAFQSGEDLTANSSIVCTRGRGRDRSIHLRFVDPASDAREQIIDVSLWGRFSNLWRPFCEAVVAWGVDKTPRCRSERIKDLSRGWFEFLETVPDGRSLEINQIDTALVNRFIYWLNQTDADGRSRWAIATRKIRLGAIKNVLNMLHRNGVAQGAGTVVPKYVWPGVSRTHVPTKVVSTDALVGLYEACMKEIKETMAFVNEGRRLIETSRGRVPVTPGSQSDYKDLGVCLAAVERTFQGVVPDRWGIRQVNNHLHNAILAYHGFSEIPKYFYPQPRLLVPFVLLLAIYTSANADMVLEMKRSDFERQVALGKERLVWRGYKSRAFRRQRRSFPIDDADDNPSTVLDFLEGWSARLRSCAEKYLSDNVFLFVAKWGGRKQVGAFHGINGYSAWSANLRLFLKEHGLEKIGLRVVRASGLDLVHELFDGDLRAVKAAGGQKNNLTILNHYTSDAARQRNAERTGTSIQLYNRWRETNGASDSRKIGSKEDHGACTPGWRCFDPYNSPIAGQTAGKLCVAYGACPICPLAHVDVTSPVALARLLQLRQAIESAQTSVPAERWLRVWAPRLAALNQVWISSFSSEDVVDSAAKLDLPPLPELE